MSNGQTNLERRLGERVNFDLDEDRIGHLQSCANTIIPIELHMTNFRTDRWG